MAEQAAETIMAVALWGLASTVAVLGVAILVAAVV